MERDITVGHQVLQNVSFKKKLQKNLIGFVSSNLECVFVFAKSYFETQ
jgi:hypothetical protein